MADLKRSFPAKEEVIADLQRRLAVVENAMHQRNAAKAHNQRMERLQPGAPWPRMKED